MSEKLEKLKAQIEKLSPAAQLLMASQLVAKGDFDCVEMGIALAQRVCDEWTAAKLLAKSGR